MSLLAFNPTELFFIALIFVWTGFVRSGLGFGGAALGLPLMLLIYHQPVYWLPIIGTHLLFFTSLTLRTRIKQVNWHYLRQSSVYIVPASLVGVMGLLNLPTDWLLIFIYTITLFYALMWIANMAITSNKGWLDKTLLVVGGYVAGTSLTGAPLIIAVFMRHVSRAELRNTLFVLWFVLVGIKMTAFALLSVDLNTVEALILLPVAAIGHFVGLKSHDYILQNDRLFKRVTGVVLAVISVMGLVQLSSL